MSSLGAPFACDSCTKCILFKRLCENLQRFADYDFISLENIDQAIRLKFDRPERIQIMQHLEDIGRAVLISYKGWRLPACVWGFVPATTEQKDWALLRHFFATP